MTPDLIPEMDKGFILLQAIEENSDASQRDLSSRTGLSLGSVNLLLQKMIHEGYIRMKMIPANRVAYLLTPRGIAEKAVRTIRYIQRNYQLIESSKTMIREQLTAFHKRYPVIYLRLPGNELNELIQQIAAEYKEDFPDRQLKLCTDDEEINNDNKNSILLTIPTDTSIIRQAACASSIPEASLFDQPE